MRKFENFCKALENLKDILTDLLEKTFIQEIKNVEISKK